MLTEVNLTPTSTQFNIPTPSGGSIPARSWGTPQDSKAVALLVHGLGAHSGWFEAFGRQCKVRRIYAIAFDLIGFGKRRNETLSSYTQWIDDLVRVFDFLKERVPNKPIYLVGNSMGALLSLVSTQYIQPDGVVLLSPGLDGAPETFTNLYRVKAVISALLAPEKEVALPYDETLFCRDATVQAFVKADTEGRMRVPGKMLLELLKLSNATKHKAHTVRSPVFMLTAGKDRIVNNAINQAFFTKLNAPEKKAKHFPEAWHDLMFDPLVDEVADEVVQWISEHTVERLISG